jgi:hypothetical protein
MKHKRKSIRHSLPDPNSRPKITMMALTSIMVSLMELSEPIQYYISGIVPVGDGINEEN